MDTTPLRAHSSSLSSALTPNRGDGFKELDQVSRVTLANMDLAGSFSSPRGGGTKTEGENYGTDIATGEVDIANGI